MNPVRDYKDKKNPLLSIAIPTYNRAPFLENLLNNILSQARELKGEVEICTSNNGSTDNTCEVVMKYKEKYPDLIKYRESEKNLGFDKNILKAIEMSNGNFVWTFGDDDNIVENGLKEVVKFLKRIPEENTGLIVVRRELYDKQTGKKIIYESTLNKNQPEIFKIDKKDIIGLSFPDIAFISALIFNNKIVKKIFREDRAIIEKGIGTEYIHIPLYSLMFLKYPYINGIAFNKIIVSDELLPYYYKVFIEAEFRLHYTTQKKLNRLLLSNKYMNDNYAPLIVKRDRSLRRIFITDMMVLRAFESFNYSSYFDCLRLFFQYATFIDALLFSLVFSILFLIPPAVLEFMHKVLLIIRHGKKWRSQWQLTSSLAYRIFRGIRK